ncbi:MAG: hypothetical protein ACI9GZ_004152 [Bacteroidia bacterium]|jgi:hypothetical protein
MNLNKYIVLTCIIVVGSLAIYTLILKKEKEQIKNSYQAAIKNNKSSDALNTSLLYNSYELQKVSWLHSMYGVDKEILLTDKENIKNKLIDKLNGFTLLFSFDSNMCNPCIDREIQNMKVLTSTFENINSVITTQGLHSSYVFKDEKFKGLESNIFTVRTPPLKAGALVDSPTFVFFDNKTPLFFYHPDKNHNRAFDMLLQALEITMTDK